MTRHGTDLSLELPPVNLESSHKILQGANSDSGNATAAKFVLCKLESKENQVIILLGGPKFGLRPLRRFCTFPVKSTSGWRSGHSQLGQPLNGFSFLRVALIKLFHAEVILVKGGRLGNLYPACHHLREHAGRRAPVRDTDGL